MQNSRKRTTLSYLSLKFASSRLSLFRTCDELSQFCDRWNNQTRSSIRFVFLFLLLSFEIQSCFYERWDLSLFSTSLLFLDKKRARWRAVANFTKRRVLPRQFLSIPLCNIPRDAHGVVFVEPLIAKHPCVVAIVLRNGMQQKVDRTCNRGSNGHTTCTSLHCTISSTIIILH